MCLSSRRGPHTMTWRAGFGPRALCLTPHGSGSRCRSNIWDWTCIRIDIWEWYKTCLAVQETHWSIYICGQCKIYIYIYYWSYWQLNVQVTEFLPRKKENIPDDVIRSFIYLSQWVNYGCSTHFKRRTLLTTHLGRDFNASQRVHRYKLSSADHRYSDSRDRRHQTASKTATPPGGDDVVQPFLPEYCSERSCSFWLCGNAFQLRGSIKSFCCFAPSVWKPSETLSVLSALRDSKVLNECVQSQVLAQHLCS